MQTPHSNFKTFHLIKADIFAIQINSITKQIKKTKKQKWTKTAENIKLKTKIKEANKFTIEHDMNLLLTNMIKQEWLQRGKTKYNNKTISIKATRHNKNDYNFNLLHLLNQEKRKKKEKKRRRKDEVI